MAETEPLILMSNVMTQLYDAHRIEISEQKFCFSASSRVKLAYLIQYRLDIVLLLRNTAAWLN
jgi:hypothetical protein